MISNCVEARRASWVKIGSICIALCVTAGFAYGTGFIYSIPLYNIIFNPFIAVVFLCTLSFLLFGYAAWGAVAKRNFESVLLAAIILFLGSIAIICLA